LLINGLLASLSTGLFVALDPADLAEVVDLVTDGFLAAAGLVAAGFVTLEEEEAAEAGFFSPFFSAFFSAGLPTFKEKQHRIIKIKQIDRTKKILKKCELKIYS